ncbi:hypothetical protein SASPL_139601 [Salvia splendens]|uniref:Eukaryotic translation initiation factor 2C n=1 Tax=Salvia splendens TaxID=180675 RepID=A0A8X8WQ07_SALSN|nr:hypothetical protein SASPL_139601 [Salvia splendens]
MPEMSVSLRRFNGRVWAVLARAFLLPLPSELLYFLYRFRTAALWSPPPQQSENRILPVRRPESMAIAGRSVNLLVNHFLVKFNPRNTIYHYSLDIRQLVSYGKRPARRSRNTSGLRLILNKLFLDDQARFPANRTAYDGEKNLYSAVSLPTGQFRVELSAEDLSTQTYVVSIKIMNELKLSKLEDYLSGKVPYVPRDILRGMDMVMKENPSRGFQSTLRPTAQGIALCLDCSVMSCRKPLPVVEFLKEHIPEFDGAFLDLHLRRRVAHALKGLTVRVTHRRTKQQFTITGLTGKITRDLWFDFVDPIGKDPSVKVSLVQYFREKYGKVIVYQDIPCLILGRNNRTNHVPMEFCILTEGQRYRKELLDEARQEKMIEKCLPRPPERRKTISEMMQGHDGPCGDVTRNFGFQVEKNMTSVEGRIIIPPDLKLGAVDVVRVEDEKRQWNLAENSVVEGKRIDRWALIDFSYLDFPKLRAKGFISNLRNRLKSLRIVMEEPLLCHSTGMRDFSSVSQLEELLRNVVHEGNRKYWNKFVACPTTRTEETTSFLVTSVSRLTQSLGEATWSSLEDFHFEEEDHVMFVGADVNHPLSKKSTTPSIAAVVATVNWPAVNRYAARGSRQHVSPAQPAVNRYAGRVSPQDHRTEKILDFGPICRDLVNTYHQLNGIKPKKIVVFRDGVSEGQFDMVLNEELSALKRAVFDDHYQARITLVVAQKRHKTLRFLENLEDGSATGNVPPGTVVDTKIVHPFELDFYLCIGTSKAVRAVGRELLLVRPADIQPVLHV